MRAVKRFFNEEYNKGVVQFLKVIPKFLTR